MPSEPIQGSIGGIPAIDPRYDSRFRDLTARGNKALAAGRNGQAGRLHRAALEDAERLLALASHESAVIMIAPMVLTVAARNLAAVLSRAGKADAARAVSVRAAERLIAVADCVTTPVALRLNCLRHLRHALHFLAEFDHVPDHPGEVTARLARRTAEVGAEIIRVAGLWKRAAGAQGAAVAS